MIILSQLSSSPTFLSDTLNNVFYLVMKLISETFNSCMALYSLFVLKVPLTNQPTYRIYKIYTGYMLVRE